MFSVLVIIAIIVALVVLAMKQIEEPKPKQTSTKHENYNVPRTYTNLQEKAPATKVPSHPVYKKLADVYYQFDIDKLKLYTKGQLNKVGDFYFITPEEYKNKCKNYVATINLLLKKAHDDCNNFPLIQYNAETLKFDRTDLNINNFCILQHHPLTATGKTAKYPYSILLWFNNKRNDWVHVYFDKNGNFAKGQVNSWVPEWYGCAIKIFQKELQICRIDKLNSGGVKERIYDRTATKQVQ